VLVELTKMERRYDAVLGVIHGRGRALLAHVCDHNLQATHCVESPTGTGRWFAPSGDRWWRVWSCPDHLDGLTRLRESGRRFSG
jgi:hypothetical protein